MVKLINCDSHSVARDIQFCYINIRIHVDPSMPLLRDTSLPPVRSQSATMDIRLCRLYNEGRMAAKSFLHDGKL